MEKKLPNQKKKKTYFLNISFIIGPKTSLIVFSKSCAFSKTRQPHLLIPSQLTTANFSWVLRPILSLTSLGKTICPRSSTLTRASTFTLQQSQTSAICFFIINLLSQMLINQNNQNILKIIYNRVIFVKRRRLKISKIAIRQTF